MFISNVYLIDNRRPDIEIIFVVVHDFSENLLAVTYPVLGSAQTDFTGASEDLTTLPILIYIKSKSA